MSTLAAHPWWVFLCSSQAMLAQPSKAFASIQSSLFGKLAGLKLAVIFTPLRNRYIQYVLKPEVESEGMDKQPLFCGRASFSLVDQAGLPDLTLLLRSTAFAGQFNGY
eukprot:scaffold49036_cov19-Tisochrysis_lutea.AAC.1